MENKKFLNVSDVDYMDISVPTASKIIRGLNNELKSQSHITVTGKVSKAYFNPKIFGAQSA